MEQNRTGLSQPNYHITWESASTYHSGQRWLGEHQSQTGHREDGAYSYGAYASRAKIHWEERLICSNARPVR
eukprot:scaffold460_cov445-Prasinococcus_capsulatus_cf.AAC.5